MNLGPEHLSQLHLLAEQAALAAGKLIQNTDLKALDIQYKQGPQSLAAQVVTEVDKRSERLIYDKLKPTLERYDLAFLGEESSEVESEDAGIKDTDERHIKDYFWCVDPLDGTLSFTQQVPGYAVAIALVSKAGVPVIGVVYDPYYNVLYSAALNQGFTRNGLPYNNKVPSPLSSPNQTGSSSQPKKQSSQHLTLACDRSLSSHPLYEPAMATITHWLEAQALDGIHKIEQAGAVMNALWALENPPACYFKLPKPERGGGSLWDFAATACIYQEASARVSDCYGQALDLNSKTSTFMNLKGVIYSTEPSLHSALQTLAKR